MFSENAPVQQISTQVTFLSLLAHFSLLNFFIHFLYFVTETPFYRWTPHVSATLGRLVAALASVFIDVFVFKFVCSRLRLYFWFCFFFRRRFRSDSGSVLRFRFRLGFIFCISPTVLFSFWLLISFSFPFLVFRNDLAWALISRFGVVSV